MKQFIFKIFDRLMDAKMKKEIADLHLMHDITKQAYAAGIDSWAKAVVEFKKDMNQRLEELENSGKFVFINQQQFDDLKNIVHGDNASKGGSK